MVRAGGVASAKTTQKNRVPCTQAEKKPLNHLVESLGGYLIGFSTSTFLTTSVCNIKIVRIIPYNSCTSRQELFSHVRGDLRGMCCRCIDAVIDPVLATLGIGNIAGGISTFNALKVSSAFTIILIKNLILLSFATFPFHSERRDFRRQDNT